MYNHTDSEGNTIAGCGIHASGAQFEMMDSLKYDRLSNKDPVQWMDWAEAAQKVAMFANRPLLSGRCTPRGGGQALMAGPSDISRW